MRICRPVGAGILLYRKGYKHCAPDGATCEAKPPSLRDACDSPTRQVVFRTVKLQLGHSLFWSRSVLFS